MELRSPAHRVLLAPQDCGRYRTRRTSGNMHLHSLAVTTSAMGWFIGLTILKWKICLSQHVQKTGIGFQDKILHLATAVEMVIKPRMRMVSPR